MLEKYEASPFKIVWAGVYEYHNRQVSAHGKNPRNGGVNQKDAGRTSSKTLVRKLFGG
jgi:hypothetical protein